jgi:hypothetical protein
MRRITAPSPSSFCRPVAAFHLAHFDDYERKLTCKSRLFP